MKIGQLLLGLPVALLFCTAVILTEKDRFERLEVVNPFRSAIETSPLYENTTDENRFFLSPNREIIVLAPDARFTRNDRTLEQGRLFLDQQFLTITDITNSRTINAQSPETGQAKVGQIKVGEIVVSTNGKRAVIERDNTKNQTLIHTFADPINFWLPGAKDAFFMPPYHRVTLRDNLLSPESGQTFYTKQKKEVLLTDMSDKLDQQASAQLSFYNDANELVESFKIKVIDFGAREPFRWFPIAPQTLVGQAGVFLKSTQRYYALNYSDALKADYGLKKILMPIAKKYYTYELEDAKKLPNSSEASVFLRSPEVLEYLITNPEKQAFFDDFIVAQKAWTNQLPADDEKRSLSAIWASERFYQYLGIDWLEQQLDTTSQALEAGQTTRTKQALERFNTQVRSLNLRAEDHSRWTNLRRYYIYLIQTYDRFLTVENLETLNKIIATEIDLIRREPDQFNEHTLENAQLVLAIFKTVNNPEAPDENESLKLALREIFLTLEVEEALNRIGRELFTDEQLQTIQAVSAYNKYLDEKESEERRKQQAALDFINQTNAPKPTTEIIEEVEDDIIDTKVEFEAYLSQKGVNLSSASITTSAQKIWLKNAIYNSQILEADLDIETQSFTKISYAGQIQRTPTPLPGFAPTLDRLQIMAQTQQSNNQAEEEEDPIFASLRLATINKIAEDFGIADIKLNSNQIVPKNTESLAEFIVTDAIVDKQFKVDFTYLVRDEKVTDLVLRKDNNRFSFGSRVFKMKELSGQASELYRAKFEE